ncbi:MAG TPA: TetR/AcrR family transcriptional regulator, partial [Chthoniobacteraceae bacterium]|nr:TetR/AcrR family transcriptional regulator [Chthoniobacteraceae bacterium]
MQSSTIHETARGRPARAGDSRRAILAAAADAFASAGQAGARMDAIADAAGVNKALLYYYFKSKESLFQAVVEDHFEAFNRDAVQLLAGPGPARSVLLRYASLHFDFICSRLRYAGLYQQLMSYGGKPLDSLVKKYFLPRSRALDKLLERGMKTGEFRKADRMNTAVSIASLIVFYFSSAPVMRLIRPGDPYSPASLKRR